MAKEPPQHYQQIKAQFPGLFEGVESLGKACREAGPLDVKTAHLVQLGAATACGSEGAVHSHVRRAREAGASADEILHAIVVVTSTVGFPAVMAALSWAGDILNP